MGARMSSLVDALIDAKVQGEMNDQITLLERIDELTVNDDNNRKVFVEERGMRVCSEMIVSPNHTIATLAVRVLGNIACSEELASKLSTEVDFADIIVQLKIYPPTYAQEAFRTLTLLCTSDHVRQQYLELGIFDPLQQNIRAPPSQSVLLSACHVCARISENTSVSRILIKRDMLEVFIRLANHSDPKLKAASMAVLANMCKGVETKSPLINSGVVLQFLLMYDDEFAHKDKDVRRESIRGFKNFTEVFTDPTNLRHLNPIEMEFISKQTQMKFPAVLGRGNLEIDMKDMKRRSVPQMMARVEEIAKALIECDHCSLWVHDEANKQLWTYDHRLNTRLDKDSGYDTKICKDTAGLLGDVFQSGRQEIVGDVIADRRWTPSQDVFHSIVSRNMLLQPIEDKKQRRIMGVIQIINKRQSIEELRLIEKANKQTEEDNNFFSYGDEVATTNKPKTNEEIRVYSPAECKAVEALGYKTAAIMPMLIDKQRMILRNMNLAVDKDAKKKALDIDISHLANTDVRTVLKVIMASAKAQLECATASFYVYQADQKILWGVKDDGVSEFRMSSDKGIAGRAAREGKLIILDDAYLDPDFNDAFDKLNNFRTKTMLVAPVRSFVGLDPSKSTNGRVIGVFQMINKKHGRFNRSDIQKLEGIQNATISVLESKMRELETELYERRQYTLEGLAVLSRALVDSANPVRLEAAQAVCNICFSELNHSELLRLGAVEILVSLAEIGQLSETVSSAVKTVTPRFLAKSAEEEMLTVPIESKLRIAALSALASLSSNISVREALVGKGCLDLFLRSCTSANDNTRFQAMRGIANLATVLSTHSTLTSKKFISILELHSVSELDSDIMQVIRTVAQLARFRDNIEALYENDAWAIVNEFLTDAKIEQELERLRDILVVATEASALMCAHFEVRRQYLTDKIARKLLERLWDTKVIPIQIQVIRHCVYILEDRDTVDEFNAHSEFFETDGQSFFTRAIETISTTASTTATDKIKQYLLDSFLELVKDSQSREKILAWGLLSKLVKIESEDENVLYAFARICQTVAHTGQKDEQGIESAINRGQMLGLSYLKQIAKLLAHPSIEIREQGLLTANILIQGDPQPLLFPDNKCLDIAQALVKLFIAQNHSAREKRLAIKAARLLIVLSQFSGANRTKIIECGIIPYLVELAHPAAKRQQQNMLHNTTTTYADNDDLPSSDSDLDERLPNNNNNNNNNNQSGANSTAKTAPTAKPNANTEPLTAQALRQREKLQRAKERQEEEERQRWAVEREKEREARRLARRELHNAAKELLTRLDDPGETNIMKS